MLLCSQLLIENQVECKVSFLIERGMFAIKVLCILNDQKRGVDTPLFGQPFFRKINFHYVSLKTYLIQYAEQN